jgi:hypothetical protein
MLRFFVATCCFVGSLLAFVLGLVGVIFGVVMSASMIGEIARCTNDQYEAYQAVGACTSGGETVLSILLLCIVPLVGGGFLIFLSIKMGEWWQSKRVEQVAQTT